MRRWTKIIAVLSMALLGLLAMGVAYAQTVVDVAEDAYTDGWDPDVAYGTDNENWVAVGIFEEGRTRLGLLKFNLPPIDVTDAKLRIRIENVWGAAGISSYIVEDIPNTWDEATVTGNSIWPTILPKWADGIMLDTQGISEDSILTDVEWDVTSAVQAAGPNGTVSFYLGIDHYKPMVANVWTFKTKELDPTFTDTAKLIINGTGVDGTLTGYVNLEDWDMTKTDYAPVKVEFVPTIGGAARTEKVWLDPDNINFNYTVNLITSGTYDVYYSACKWLRKKVPGVVISEGNVTVQDVSLFNGDLNGDNDVTSTDLSVAIANIDKVAD